MDLQVSKQGALGEIVNPGAVSSIIYHDLFDYPLTLVELIKWESGTNFNKEVLVRSKNGLFFIDGREGTILKRMMRKRISGRKLAIARKAAAILNKIPWVKFLGITGALAMENADDASDIDLIIITQKGTLWRSRLLTLLLLVVLGIPTRRFGQKVEKDKLCLNMWLDENDLVWPNDDRNPYTAHEIAQIVPLINKDKTYESFIFANRWLRRFWPNAVAVGKIRPKARKQESPFGLFEALAYFLQVKYMSSKITREIVTPTRAIFHPHDWGSLVLTKLTS